MSGQNKVSGVVLAGGRARRMGKLDKGLVLCGRQPMVSYALRAMSKVSDVLWISANRNIEQYRAFGYPVVTDAGMRFDGPLAGILAALQQAPAGILLVAPCDSPLIEAKHLQRLLDAQARHDAEIAVAFDGERIHPVFMALKTDLAGSLQAYLQQDQRRMDLWLQQHDYLKVDFSDEPEIFANINSLPELNELEQSIFASTMAKL